jgi:hypothetical protein
MKNSLEKVEASGSFEGYNFYLSNLATLPSMKGSLVSEISKGSHLLDPDNHLNQKERILHVLSANLHQGTTEISLDDGWEEVDVGNHYDKVYALVSPKKSKARTPANFHKQYLEMGQWPEMKFEDQVGLRDKYSKLKNKLRRTQIEQIRYSNPPPCKKCTVYQQKNIATKEALSEALMMSNSLLREVKRLEDEIASEEIRNRNYEENRASYRKYHSRKTVSFVGTNPFSY